MRMQLLLKKKLMMKKTLSQHSCVTGGMDTPESTLQHLHSHLLEKQETTEMVEIVHPTAVLKIMIFLILQGRLRTHNHEAARNIVTIGTMQELVLS